MLAGGEQAHMEGDLAGGYYVKPTVLFGNNKMRVFQEEIVGPVASVTTFTTDEEALALANDTLYGLGAGVWTRDGTRGYRFGSGIQAGRVWTNCYRLYPAHTAFGGHRQSGIGQSGIGHWALGIGHWALGIGHWARDAQGDARPLPADQEHAGELQPEGDGVLLSRTPDVVERVTLAEAAGAAPSTDGLPGRRRGGQVRPMATPLLHLQDIALRLGSNPLLDGAELAVSEGERVCLVGRNGSGKSTLLRIAAGLVEPDSGTCFIQPGATVRYLAQEPDLAGFTTVGAYVAAGQTAGDDAHRARYLLEQLGLSEEATPGNLSGGEARRAALARALAPEPDILLLDEPTNHLDLPAIAWLEAELASLRSAVVLISHDRRMLETLSRAIVWLDRGRTRRLDRGFAAFEGWRDEVLAQEERDRHKLGRKIAREEDWLRYGVTARRTRNQKRLADLHTLRRTRREQVQAPSRVRMEAADAELSGKLVAVAEHATKAWNERTVVRDLTTRVLRGDRVGIVGPNGAGKTTLLSLLTGALAPDSGEVRLGTNLTAVTLDQRRESLDPTATLAVALTGGHGDMVDVAGQRRHVIGYMKDFLFGPEQANTPVGVLSGGERGRLMLARALARPANLLVLDEPTNDLDLETLDLLQELLADHPGTVLLVSHDRDFLDRVVTSTLAAEGDGRWTEYAGGYTDMLAQRGTPAPTARPGGPSRTPATAEPKARQQPAPGRRRMSFNEQHALKTLPARIAALEAEVTRQRAALADPDLYARNPAGFTQLTASLAETEASLATAEEQWLKLEMMREELES